MEGEDLKAIVEDKGHWGLVDHKVNDRQVYKYAMVSIL